MLLAGIQSLDLEVGVRGEVEGDVIKEGAVTVNAKKIYEIIREVPHDMVQLKRLENDWVEIRSGKSVFKIVGIDAKEFPQFPKFDSKALSTTPASTMREMIERTIFSVSTLLGMDPRFHGGDIWISLLGKPETLIDTDILFDQESIAI